MDNTCHISTIKKFNVLLRLFPYLDDKLKILQLKIDEESLRYISLKEYANKISNIMCFHLKDLKENIRTMTLTDATAGVGGNTISFAIKCPVKKIYAVEIDKMRAAYLKNNVNIYNLKNVEIINDNYLNISQKLNNDIVFIDPPWGGYDYKDHKMLKLSLSNVPIEKICKDLMNSKTKMIILKLPGNFDIMHFYGELSNYNIYYYDLTKMMILVIMNK
jgi:predicted RNA methylase